MKPRNADIKKKIQDNAPIFQAARRSDITMQIRSKMAEKGLKNVDIAARLGVSEANISRWLRGNQNLSIDTIYQLADALEEPLYISVGTMRAAAQEDLQLENQWTDCGVESDNIVSTKAFDLVDQHIVRTNNVFDIAIYAQMRSQVRPNQMSQFSAARSENGASAHEDYLMVN